MSRPRNPDAAAAHAALLAAEADVLVLQGGGALGAYQAGAFEHLAAAGHDITWVAGISIGAINAAIICGNPAERRLARLRQFWEGVSASLALSPVLEAFGTRQAFTDLAAASVMTFGVPGFFRPRLPWGASSLMGNPVGASFYDTGPLRDTLMKVVDFDYLNEDGPRLSVGAVDVETGNFAYFDSRRMKIGPEHVMASGALPPGFPSIEIGGRSYWDGGLVSNTPLQYVLEEAGSRPLCVFQVDVFSARGGLPETIADVVQREKDIRFSSRTRLTTDRFRQLHDVRAAADRLAAKLPPDLASDPDLAFLRATGPDCPVTLVHLIHRKEAFEGASKDYEFSRLSMNQHWAAGQSDVKRTFAHKLWRDRTIEADGLKVFDLTAKPGDA